MCGIAGGFWSMPTASLRQHIESALSAMRQRGPDHQGYDCHSVLQGTVVLGHTRLSIIDLSSSAQQPMYSANNRFGLVFNGEIYNYRELRQELRTLGHVFTSNSDTEVLLASWITWGHACLQRLRGMFAFVLFDRAEKKLVCVRDAFGIKPLFYRLDQDGFLFASEIPALLTLLPNRPPLNLQRVYDYLVPGNYDDKTETFFQGVLQLLPGHTLTLDLAAGGNAVIRRWWWPSVVEHKGMSFSDATDQLRSMFLNNIKLHLRSDVPLGAALSGGVDSSAVVCAIRQVAPDMPIHTFSYIARGSDVDEEHWVDLVNSHVSAVPHKVVIAPEELANDLDDMIRIQGEPFGGTSIYAQYRVFKLARDHGVTVTLDGQGADELLAGYLGYPGSVMHSLIERGQFFELIAFLQRWSQWPGRSISYGVQACISQFVPDRLQSFAHKVVGRNPAPTWLDVSYLKEYGVSTNLLIKGDNLADVRGRRLSAALRQTLTGRGLSSLLRHGDRNSMRWSVESRVPFLTTDMAEFVLGLPEHYLISKRGETKHIFRAAMRGIVPDTILDRRDKIGFATPERVWLKQLGGRVFEWLEAADNLPFLKLAECRAEVAAVIEGRKRFNYQAWRLINLCRWSQIVG